MKQIISITISIFLILTPSIYSQESISSNTPPSEVNKQASISNEVLTPPKPLSSLIQTNILLNTPTINSLKLNRKKTTQNILLLSIITVLPLLNLTRLIDSPEFRTEIYISTALFSLPAAFGWPLFARDLSKHNKYKKFNNNKLKRKARTKKNAKNR